MKCQNATPAHITNTLTCHAIVSAPESTAGWGSASNVASIPQHQVTSPNRRWTAFTSGRIDSGSMSSAPSFLNASAPMAGDRIVRHIVRRPSLPCVVVKWGLSCVALLR